jgi:hypothetical protein
MRRVSDSKQRLLVALAFVLEFYKVTMGSMLTLFVPHQCAADGPGLRGNASAACTLGEGASKTFACGSCGKVFDRDHNASRNVMLRWLVETGGA